MKNTSSLLVISTILILHHATEADTFSTSLGGYGELHMNYARPDSGHAFPPTLDFHRFVLFAGHAFNERWSFKSELELEHNLVEVSGTQKASGFELKKSGYLALEQAAIHYRHDDWLHIAIGVVLTPAGSLNSDHEPHHFLTVERPLYYNRIIPSTWFGNGIAIYGSFHENRMRYHAVLMEGLNTANISAQEGLRSARQKGLYASAASALAGLRLDYDLLPNLSAGLSHHRDQLLDNPEGRRPYDYVSVTEAHLRYTGYGIRLTTEWAYLDYNSLQPTAGLLRSGYGWFGEIGYNIGNPLRWDTQWIPFIYLSRINPAARLHGNTSGKPYEIELWKVGLNVLPVPQIVFKADIGYSTGEQPARRNLEANLGMGYHF